MKKNCTGSLITETNALRENNGGQRLGRLKLEVQFQKMYLDGEADKGELVQYVEDEASYEAWCSARVDRVPQTNNMNLHLQTDSVIAAD